jgi:hypothetical protein
MLLGRLVLRIALWFAPCVVAWYFIAPWADALVASGARILIGGVLPGVVRQAEVAAGELTFETAIAAPGGGGVLTVDVNPLLYSYGIALYAAIVLGARTRGAWWTLPVGVAVVVAITAWGVAFDFMAHLVRSAPGALASLGAGTVSRNLIALGYQMGSLLFPAVIPAALALAIARKELLPTATDAGERGRVAE